jgi:hypothetical protein
MPPSAMSRVSTPDDPPAELRKRAAAARRLARHVSPRDAEQLREIAIELDARALRQEAAERDDKHDEGGL